MIDNVGQLEGKLNAQRELVYLIDQMEQVRKPVVITMQSSPVEANHLMSQLMSRLCGGVALPVFPPGIEARRKIISRLSELHMIPLEPEASEWIARRMMVSVPKLNHFFVQLKTELKSRDDLPRSNEPVDMMTLGLVFQQDESTVDAIANQIIESVAREFELSTAILCSNSRKQTVVTARGIAIWLLRTMVGISYHAIGKRFGNRDHTTILHAFQKYDSLIQTESDDSEGKASLTGLVKTLQHRLNDTFAGQMTLVP
jgi:chromosomal replication initiator protein